MRYTLLAEEVAQRDHLDAGAVNRTLYGDRPPGSADADEAWGALSSIERELRRERGRRVAVQAVLDPRSLRYPTPRPAPLRARRPVPRRARRTDHPRAQRI